MGYQTREYKVLGGNDGMGEFGCGSVTSHSAVNAILAAVANPAEGYPYYSVSSCEDDVTACAYREGDVWEVHVCYDGTDCDTVWFTVPA